jgi:hypothetical protein
LICNFFAFVSKAQKAWLETKKVNFLYTYFAIFLQNLIHKDNFSLI